MVLKHGDRCSCARCRAQSCILQRRAQSRDNGMRKWPNPAAPGAPQPDAMLSLSRVCIGGVVAQSSRRPNTVRVKAGRTAGVIIPHRLRVRDQRFYLIDISKAWLVKPWTDGEGRGSQPYAIQQPHSKPNSICFGLIPWPAIQLPDIYSVRSGTSDGHY